MTRMGDTGPKRSEPAAAWMRRLPDAGGPVMFTDRRDAGRQLAAELPCLDLDDPVVVALPRGGVPVAYEVARVLGAPLDVLGVRKLGAPGQPEFAIGAIAEEDVSVLDPETARRTGTTEAVLERTIRLEPAELRRRVRAYRGERPPVPLSGRTAIVVDDGLATGLTVLAAVRAVRRRGAARVVVAAPVGSAQAIALLRSEADKVVCVTRLRCVHELVVVPEAGHLFEEPGALVAVARHAGQWFTRHLAASAAQAA